MWGCVKYWNRECPPYKCRTKGNEAVLILSCLGFKMLEYVDWIKLKMAV